MGARAAFVIPTQLKKGKQDFSSPLEILGLERILWRVWCEALSIPGPLSKERMSCLCKSGIWKGSWFLPGCRNRVAYPALAGQEFIVPRLFGVSVSGAE